jgi:hypothetical protein
MRRSDGSTGSSGAAHLSPALGSVPRKVNLGGAGWHADDGVYPRSAGARHGAHGAHDAHDTHARGNIRSTADEWAEWEQIRASLGDGRSEALARAAAAYASLTRAQRALLALRRVAARAWYVFDAQLANVGFLALLMVLIAFFVATAGGRLLQLQAARSRDAEMDDIPINFTARACTPCIPIAAFQQTRAPNNAAYHAKHKTHNRSSPGSPSCSSWAAPTCSQTARRSWLKGV